MIGGFEPCSDNLSHSCFIGHIGAAQVALEAYTYIHLYINIQTSGVLTYQDDDRGFDPGQLG